MTDPRALLDAHVSFVLARWSGEQLEQTLAEHVNATLVWLADTRVGDLAPAAETARVAGVLASRLVLSDELIAVVADVAATGHGALLEAETTIAELVPREDFDALVELIGSLEDARGRVIDAVTGSEAYRRLVSHVLYQGLKGYLLTENVLARKVPGASSLVKLGQRGLNSAAPKLEAGVDRRLTAFVQANLAETLRESRRYLEATIDAEAIGELAVEAWDEVADLPVRQLVDALAPADLEALVAAFGPVLRQWRDVGLLGAITESVVRQELEWYADHTAGELLEACGIDVASLVTDVVALLRPSIEHATAAGFLEERVRAELTPFYRSLEASDLR